MLGEMVESCAPSGCRACSVCSPCTCQMRGRIVLNSTLALPFHIALLSSCVSSSVKRSWCFFLVIFFCLTQKKRVEIRFCHAYNVFAGTSERNEESGSTFFTQDWDFGNKGVVGCRRLSLRSRTDQIQIKNVVRIVVGVVRILMSGLDELRLVCDDDAGAPSCRGCVRRKAIAPLIMILVASSLPPLLAISEGGRHAGDHTRGKGTVQQHGKTCELISQATTLKRNIMLTPSEAPFLSRLAVRGIRGAIYVHESWIALGCKF